MRKLGSMALAMVLAAPVLAIAGGERPHIVWIVSEDASPHIGCYGETLIKTPNLDRMAAEGVRFENAFVTSPVCSPSRSAMITGVYPTAIGAQNHRSQRGAGKEGRKGGGSVKYHDSYRLPFASVPELFRVAGYHVSNGGLNKEGKWDYNFIIDSPYAGVRMQKPWQGTGWMDHEKGQPFFAQVHLNGGKKREGLVYGEVSREKVKAQLPPYYPQHDVIVEDWANYLGTWADTDSEVGMILDRLRERGELENTIIFFWTDHGISHVRGKQFLYDEGIRVPLIVRFGDKAMAGTVRKDEVLQIDVAAASLALAGIEIPPYVQGRDIFANDYKPRDVVVCARDRCDETIDIIRCVRTPQYKYIRNFLSYLPAAQPNAYKDGKAIMKVMRQRHEEGALSELQARVFEFPRPTEELYDLVADPYETVNLADDPKHADTLAKLRTRLYDWMEETGDLGLIPEPIAEDLGRDCGSKSKILTDPANAGLVRQLIRVIEAGEKDDLETLHEVLESGCPSEQYWAATWLGLLGDNEAIMPLEGRVAGDVPAVRIAASLALYRIDPSDDYIEPITREITHENLLVGMYAMNAIEQSGLLNQTVAEAAELARKSRYEFTRRYGRRLAQKCAQQGW